MRLKEDTSNWKASNILRKVKPLPEEPIYHHHKPTRKWCKGKVGVKHVYKEVERGNRFWHYVKYRCENCGKEKYS